jgi:hypothetical protein
MAEAAFEGLLAQSIEEISRWRDQGGQTFQPEEETSRVASLGGFETTPRLLRDRPENGLL